MIAEHTQTTTEAPIVLQCVDLCKCYNGVVQASDHINFTLRRGEVHAFLGENGAGKSTLMKMLYGIEQPDEGQMFLSGEPVVLKSPADAIAHGIGMVHQELMLIPHLTVAENITLGQEVRTRCGRLKKQEASRSIRELAASYGLDIDPDALVDKLTIGQRQRVEIVKLLYRKADILIFDEPTTGLDPQTRKLLWDVVTELRRTEKLTVFLTTHYMEEAADADYVVILDSGKIVGEGTPLQLKNIYAGDFVMIYGVDEAAVKALGRAYTPVRDGWRIAVANTGEATKLIIENPALFVDYEITKGKMDDVFLAVTGKKLNGGEEK